MKHQKIIFLDIDGVICNANALFYQRFAGHRDLVDSLCTSLIFKLAESTQASIVISSSWRRATSVFPARFERAMLGAGIQDYKSVVIGETPFRNDAHRGKEIEDWLQSTPMIIDKYVIIDDDSDMLEHQLPFFVKTDGDTGFTAKDFLKAYQILTGNDFLKN